MLDDLVEGDAEGQHGTEESGELVRKELLATDSLDFAHGTRSHIVAETATDGDDVVKLEPLETAGHGIDIDLGLSSEVTHTGEFRVLGVTTSEYLVHDVLSYLLIYGFLILEVHGRD